jgi:hypothetical protein
MSKTESDKRTPKRLPARGRVLPRPSYTSPTTSHIKERTPAIDIWLRIPKNELSGLGYTQNHGYVPNNPGKARVITQLIHV